VATDRLTLSRKDYADYEFIVKESERLIALGDIKQRMKYYSEHKEDALSALLGSEGRALECTRQGAQRFTQIVARGLEALGPPARRHICSMRGSGARCSRRIGHSAVGPFSCLLAQHSPVIGRG
jgi:hypothetical protein